MIEPSTSFKDIEDLIDENNGDDTTRETKMKAIRKNFRKKEAKSKLFDLDQQNVSHVPGTQKIYVKTFGCSHNMSDSEFMMG